MGKPLRFILTTRQAHESKQTEASADGFDFDKLLADKGFDSDRFRAGIATAWRRRASTAACIFVLNRPRERPIASWIGAGAIGFRGRPPADIAPLNRAADS